MPVVFAFLLDCHPRESGGPGQATLQLPWIPAFAGMTFEKVYRTRLPNLAPMRDRVRGLAPAGADGSVASKRAASSNRRVTLRIARCDLSGFISRCRASPLTLSLSHKGRGDSVGRPCVSTDLCAFPSAFAMRLASRGRRRP